MHEEVIWLSADITEQSLRVWGYNENAQFDFQDEDLLLHSEEFFPSLIGMADDPKCPKADYIISCLDHYLMNIARHDNVSHLSSLELAITCCLGATQERVREWAALQVRRLRYRAGLGRISREQALEVGKDLLFGMANWVGSSLEVISESPSELVLARVWKDQNYFDFLMVDLENGTVRCRRSFRFA